MQSKNLTSMPIGGNKAAIYSVEKTMSEYYLKLNPISRRRYEEKMALLDMTDPYEKKIQMISWMTSLTWRNGHQLSMDIFSVRPGVYTRHQLLQWKSLEAFNYFSCGNVRVVKIKKMLGCCVWRPTVYMYVNPSQSSPDKACLGGNQKRWHHYYMPLYLYGWVSITNFQFTWLSSLQTRGRLFSLGHHFIQGWLCSSEWLYSKTSSLCGWNQVFSSKVKYPLR